MAEKQRAKLQIKEHPEFPTTNSLAVMSSRDLCKYVNSVFSKLFVDWAGSIVHVEPSNASIGLNPIQLSIFFKLGPVQTNPEGKLVAFKPISEASDVKANPAAGRKRNYIQMTTNHNYIMTHNKSAVMTQEAIDIFTPLLEYGVARQLSANPTSAEFENRGIFVESVPNAQFYGSVAPRPTVYLAVQFVNIDSFFKTLFTKEDEEDTAYYQTTPIKPIIPMNMYQGVVQPQQQQAEQRWLFNVAKLNYTNVMAKCNELGIFQSTNGINMISDSF